MEVEPGNEGTGVDHLLALESFSSCEEVYSTNLFDNLPLSAGFALIGTCTFPVGVTSVRDACLLEFEASRLLAAVGAGLLW